MARPLVTVGLPVYNGEAFVGRALAALVAQDFDALRIVVSDNGSTDATEEICRSFVGPDDRVRYHRSEVNRGAAWNFNRTFALAEGRYFKWAAHDDLCAPGYVRTCVEALQQAPPSVVLCYPRTLLIDEDDVVLGEFEDGLDLRQATPHERLRRLLRSRTEYHPIFGLMPAEALARTAVMGNFVAADVALLVELCLAGQFLEVPERLFLRRFHAKTSIRAHTSFNELAVWFDPANQGRVALPKARLLKEFLAAIRRSNLTRREKEACTGVVLRDWALPYWRHMAGELRLAARDAIDGRGRARAALPASTTPGSSSPAYASAPPPLEKGDPRAR